MNEYISRDKVLNKFIEGDGHDDDRFTEGYNFAVQEHREEVENILAADVAPVVHAHWKEGRILDICSNCGKNGFPWWNYCPGCGAYMESREVDTKT